MKDGPREEVCLLRASKGELEKQVEMLKVLEDKEKEIKNAKDNLRQAKDVTVLEYRDSDTLLAELGVCFAEGFDDALL